MEVSSCVWRDARTLWMTCVSINNVINNNVLLTLRDSMIRGQCINIIDNAIIANNNCVGGYVSGGRYKISMDAVKLTPRIVSDMHIDGCGRYYVMDLSKSIVKLSIISFILI